MDRDDERGDFMKTTETRRLLGVGFSEHDMLNATPYDATLYLAMLDGISQEADVVINPYNLFTLSIKDIRDILMRKINSRGMVG